MTSTDLRAARKALGLTQAELAARLGISVSALADYEAGRDRHNPPRERPVPQLVALAVAALNSGAAAPKIKLLRHLSGAYEYAATAENGRTRYFSGADWRAARAAAAEWLTAFNAANPRVAGDRPEWTKTG